MIDYDFISVSAFPVMDSWMLHIRFRCSVNDCEPTWYHLKAKVRAFEAESLEDILAVIGEELFNWSPLTEEAALPGGIAASYLGGNLSLAHPDDI